MAAAKDDFDLIAESSAPNTPQPVVPNFTKKAATSSTKKAPTSRKRAAPKKPEPKRKAFKAPFVPPTKAASSSSVEPDAISTPTALSDVSSTASTPASLDGNKRASRKRKEPERFTAPSPKGTFKTPAVPTKGPCSSKTPANKTPANKTTESDVTPQNPIKIKSEPQDDFDSLSITPVVGLKTPVMVQDDFDSLMVTPKEPTPAPTPVPTQVPTPTEVKIKQEPVEASRTSRKRKQTKFFGSPVKDDEAETSSKEQELPKKVKVERRTSNPTTIEHLKPPPKKLTKEQMEAIEKKQKAERIRKLRNELCGPMFKDTLLAIEHDPEISVAADLIDFLPTLVQGRLSVLGRYWGTDGERFWVKPRPDPTPLIRSNLTTAEIHAKRYVSPGPPVCPKMVVMLCEGRYPPDNISVRICLTRKRAMLKQRIRESEIFKLKFQENCSKSFKDLVSFKDRITAVHLDRAVMKLMDMVYHNKYSWTIHRYMLAKPYLNDILNVKLLGDKRLDLLVDVYFDSIIEDVNDDINTCDWSPSQCEDFKAEKFGFVNVMRSKKDARQLMRLDHDMGPMANFAPFFTTAEFELMYDDKMPEPDYNEQTATFDNDGNQTGNREFRTLRELLTPFGTLPEDTDNSEKHDDLVQWMNYKLYEEDHDKDYDPDAASEDEDYGDVSLFLSTSMRDDGGEDATQEGGEDITAADEATAEDDPTELNTADDDDDDDLTDEEYEEDEPGLAAEVEELILSQREYANAQPELYWREGGNYGSRGNYNRSSGTSSEDEYQSAAVDVEEGVEEGVEVSVEMNMKESVKESRKVEGEQAQDTVSEVNVESQIAGDGKAVVRKEDSPGEKVEGGDGEAVIEVEGSGEEAVIEGEHAESQVQEEDQKVTDSEFDVKLEG